MTTSSIDDVLAGHSQGVQIAPPTPKIEPEIAPEVPHETISESQEPQESQPVSNEYGLEEKEHSDDPSASPRTPLQVDEYGNETAPAKTYSQEEADDYANRIVRERLSRLERNNAPLTQNQQQQVQQSAQGFEYNAQNPESWQQQLEQFVEQTYYKIGNKQAQQAQQMREQQVQAEFETKFTQGMAKFRDFREVVGQQNITDSMVTATRSMKDPAAFVYAASKRAPQELQRIAKLNDPVAQMVEMGKLEERMKQVRPTTKTPKPLSRTQEDLSIPHEGKKQQPTIEQLIAQSDAKRRAALESKRRR